MAGTEMNKRRQYGSEALLIFFSIFALAVSLLVVSIRLMKQQAEGVPSTALLILAVIGIAGGVLGMLAAARSRANSSPVEEAPCLRPNPKRKPMNRRKVPPRFVWGNMCRFWRNRIRTSGRKTRN